jgi:hypothetical protein
MYRKFQGQKTAVRCIQIHSTICNGQGKSCRPQSACAVRYQEQYGTGIRFYFSPAADPAPLRVALSAFHVVAAFALLRWNFALWARFRVFGYCSQTLLFGGIVIPGPLCARFVGVSIAVNEAIPDEMLQ